MAQSSETTTRSRLARVASQWVIAAPIAGAIVLAISWDRDLPVAMTIVVGVALVAAVLSAVHHAEVVAHRVGEPFGSLVLAVAVTVIEVGLIVMLMLSSSDGKTETLARDTVFSAVMITLNGIVGLSLLVGSLRHRLPRFNPEGTGAALGVVAVLTTLTLVLPAFTWSGGDGQYSNLPLAFAAVGSLVLWLAYMLTQTRAHRDFFLPVSKSGAVLRESDHAEPPTVRATIASLGLLLVSLIAVVGLAKAASPAIEAGVAAAGIPASFIGVVIALLVLLPEGLAATRAAVRNRLQTSLNLGIGSAIASIGLTIPVIALLSIWLPGDLVLGLGPVQIVLFAVTIAVSILTVIPGRSTRLQGIVHLILFGAYIVLAIVP